MMDKIFKILVIASAVLTIGSSIMIISYILINGIPNMNIELFEWEYTPGNLSMMPAIVSTLYMTALALFMAVPVGICSAVYLAEYSGNRGVVISVIRLTTETLAGIPSIIYGLFGYVFFVIILGWSYSLIAGAATLAVMVLPLIIRTSEEAINSVPMGYREGSLGLGAGKVYTIFKIVIPCAMPNILSGIILAVGRIVGESAALIFTAGTVAQMPGSIFDSARTLSVHMYALLSEGLYTEEAYATAAVLLVMVAGINGLSWYAAKKIIAL